MVRTSRRSFAFGLGATLLAAPFVSLLNAPRAVHARDGKTARRLVLFFSPDGTVHKHWRPKVTSETDFTFEEGSILEPLNEQKSDLLICDGINFLGFDNHEPGMIGMLTGKGTAADEGGGASVDQYIAKRIGTTTKFPSLEFGVMTADYGGNTQTRMCYSSAGVFAPPEDDPVGAFKRMFGDLALGPEALANLMARRKSVLDLARTELADLRSKVGATEQLKLDQHLESLRSVEKGLATSVGGCGVPTAPTSRGVYSQQFFPEIGKAQMDLLITSLACGLTNIASLQWSHTVSPIVHTWDGLNEGHHDLSHKSDSDAAGVLNFVKAERWYAKQFSYFIAKLKETPDPAGGTLFDSTLVVWCKELGDSRLHNALSVPFILSGGASGAIRTGRYLNFEGTGHQSLLVSICNIMGLDNTKFGDASKASGPLSGLG